MDKKKPIKSISYAKWGYIFIAPFFITYAVFSLIPLVDTIRNSFYEYYYSGLKVIGPTFVGLQNYISLLSADLPKYAWNTFVMWILGFVPQIAVALLLAAWFTDARLKIHGKEFFPVFQRGSREQHPAADGSHRRGHPLHGVHSGSQNPGGADELLNVVRKYHNHAHGGHYGHQSRHL